MEPQPLDLDENNICTSINTSGTMADRSLIVLTVIVALLVFYVIKEERRSKKKPKKTPLGSKKRPSASLGAPGCTDVDVDSPDFARCSLGGGRSILRTTGGDRLNRAFKKDNYSNNRFSRKHGDAFPFSSGGEAAATTRKHHRFGAKEKESRGHKFDKPRINSRVGPVEAPPRGSSRASVDSLGAAVSPSSLGATPAEIAQSTNKLDGINKVVSNTGGNLNLLHPL